MDFNQFFGNLYKIGYRSSKKTLEDEYVGIYEFENKKLIVEVGLLHTYIRLHEFVEGKTLLIMYTNVMNDYSSAFGDIQKLSSKEGG